MSEYIIEVDYDICNGSFLQNNKKITRCRDCKHNDDGACAARNYIDIIAPDGFCSCGEPKEKSSKTNLLEPCPFCGGEAKLISVDLVGTWIECTSCQFGFPYERRKTKGEVIAAWNTRAARE